MSMKVHGETYFLTGFLRSGNTTGSPVLVVVVRGEDLVEGVSPTMGAPLFKRAETRVGVCACFFVTARPPAVGSLHVTAGGKKEGGNYQTTNPLSRLTKNKCKEMDEIVPRK